MKSDAICNMKVAMSKAKRILNKNGHLPYGTTLEDYLDKVLEQTNVHIERASDISVDAEKGEMKGDNEENGKDILVFIHGLSTVKSNFSFNLAITVSIFLRSCQKKIQSSTYNNIAIPCPK